MSSWVDISIAAKDLVEHLLCLNVKQRYNGPKVLQHRWMRTTELNRNHRLSGLMRRHSLKRKRRPNGHVMDLSDDEDTNWNMQYERKPPRKRYKNENRIVCDIKRTAELSFDVPSYDAMSLELDIAIAKANIFAATYEYDSDWGLILDLASQDEI